MKTSEYYKNKFPFEPLLPDLNETEVQDIINNCDYTIEANRIAGTDFPDDPACQINTADAAVFYIMGYEAAKERTGLVLEPIALNEKSC